MSFYKQQLQDLIERTLKERELYSESAVNLLLGTAAQESGFGKFLRQLNHGPALSIFQIERPTFEWLKDTYKKKFDLENVEFEEIEWDLKKAILFCRLRYLVVRSPLPDAKNIEALAAYWKKYYNTPLGAGTEKEFINNYKKYVQGV
ncbi:MAG: hypothetical protein PHX51_07140 [Clostridia bacterium]|nr:hypothetical protein [Clostridia bacterium]